MRISDLDLIKQKVEEAKTFPNATIEYNMELPIDNEITPTSFYGVRAKFNPMVSKETRATIIYKFN